MEKLKLAVIFGGMSTEHDVSIVSGASVLNNLDKEKYEIYPIYIDKNGKWYKYIGNIEDLAKLHVGDGISNIEKIENPIEYLKKCDIAFPVLHGLYGEDGTIQGLLELLKIKYVGCKVLASSVAMDKAYAKIIFEKAGLNQANYVYIHKIDDKYEYIDNNFNVYSMTIDEIVKKITNTLKLPVFVKPSNSGSSVGITKATTEKELKEAICYAEQFDNKIVIEEQIIGQEVECAVLGNREVIASRVGEIKSAESYYTFDAKYNNAESRTLIPAEIPSEIEEKIRIQAIKAFKAIDGNGLSRVDFFVGNNGEIYINEINTMPGFTQISMYPKLFEAAGVSYKELLDRLIELAQK